jgi:hypothetical protein
MYRPKHRAPVRRLPNSASISVATIGVFSLAVAAVVGPTANADTHVPFSHHSDSTFGAPGQGPKAGQDKPGKPGQSDPDETADDTAGDIESGAATNGGHALTGDAGLDLKELVPTAPPVTAYEMPFPCGEMWSGSTRRGHTPSVRAVDFNFAGGDLGLPVVAAAPGTVVTAVTGANRPSYGQYVVVDHGNGESSLYAHLDTVLATVGQVVSAGTQLGTVGDTGNSRGSHLHFEEQVAGAVVDAWFHGVLFPMNSSQASQNCGQGPVTQVPSTDIPLAGNLYGTKAAEMMVFRRANPAAYYVTRLGRGEQVIRIGNAADQPVLGDWDGNGRVNPGVRNPATREFELRVRGKDQIVKFGKRGDLPVAGNWDGAGAWEVGVRRPGSAKFLLRAADGTVTKVTLGDADDLPVTGDWNGDGITDLGVFDSATAMYTLRTVDAAGVELLTPVQFGTPGIGVLPVVGDWDGNGITDLGTWNGSTQTFYQRQAASPRSTNTTLGREQFRAGDLPRSVRTR